MAHPLWCFYFVSFFCIHRFYKTMCTCLSQVSCSNSSTVTSSSGSDTLLSPMGSISSRLKSLNNNNSCSESTTSSVSSLTSNYPKAPGFEREDQVHRLLSLTSGKLNPTHSLGLYTFIAAICHSFIVCHAILIWPLQALFFVFHCLLVIPLISLKYPITYMRYMYVMMTC